MNALVTQLPNTPPVSPCTPAGRSGLVLRFTEWRCGHHQDRPEPIAVNDAAQAFAILHALSHAISQPGHLRAQLYGPTDFTGAWDGIYVTDDYVAPVVADDRTQWLIRPVIIYGPTELLEEIASEALKEARDDTYCRLDDLTTGWLGTAPIEAGALVTTPLSLEQLGALGEEVLPFPTVINSAVEVVARLRAVAAEFAALNAAEADVAADAGAPGGGAGGTGEPPVPDWDAFSVTDVGVWHTARDAEGNNKKPQWICSRLDVTARTRSDDGNGWGALLHFKDPDGNAKAWAMPSAMLSGDGAEWAGRLRDMGLRMAPGSQARNLVAEYIYTRNPQDRVTCNVAAAASADAADKGAAAPLTLDQFCALPQAGAALLAAHRWLTSQPDASAFNAFDLVQAASRLPAVPVEERPGLLASLARGDDTATALFSLLYALVAIERTEAVAKSLGVPLLFPDDLFARVMSQARRSAEGGAA